jgi:hypothetical protein
MGGRLLAEKALKPYLRLMMKEREYGIGFKRCFRDFLKP